MNNAFKLICDDGSPAASSDIASIAIKTLNRRTRGSEVPDWSTPADAVKVLIDLQTMAGYLPQTMAHIVLFLTELMFGEIHGNPVFRGSDPKLAAVSAAAEQLQYALEHAQRLSDSLVIAADAINQVIPTRTPDETEGAQT
jgi:hypothetical protein